MNPLFFIGLSIAAYGLLTGTKNADTVKTQSSDSKDRANVKPETSVIDSSRRSDNGGAGELSEKTQSTVESKKDDVSQNIDETSAGGDGGDGGS